MHNAHIGGRFRWTKITCKVSDMEENLQLYRVVRFPPEIVMRNHAYISRRSENNINASCVTISGGRTKQLDIFCRLTGFTGDFLSFVVVELIHFFHGALQMVMEGSWCREGWTVCAESAIRHQPTNYLTCLWISMVISFLELLAEPL